MSNPMEGVKGDMYIINSYLRTVSTVWKTAAQIYLMTGIAPKSIRAVCQKYPHLLVSSNEGYKLARYADRYEVQSCVSDLLSRSAKMIARASRLSWKLAA